LHPPLVARRDSRQQFKRLRGMTIGVTYQAKERVHAERVLSGFHGERD
jgi:hypothetical protein